MRDDDLPHISCGVLPLGYPKRNGPQSKSEDGSLSNRVVIPKGLYFAVREMVPHTDSGDWCGKWKAARMTWLQSVMLRLKRLVGKQ
jgi:hypothetical protein